jgi:hypothetical protein
MDPYLEAPDIWPDFHNRLASHISSALNLSMPAPYYARLEMRPEVGIIEDEGYSRRIVPDVAVVRQSGNVPNASRAVLTLLDEPVHHHFVEVRDSSRGHKLITLIEIVSPSNKRRGPDRDAYRQKQREILASDASLVEIDLLRTGSRPLDEPGMAELISRLVPLPDYLVVVNRAWRRGEMGRGYQVFPVTLHDPLPCFPVPLRSGENEVALDLQFLLNRAYDEGPYVRGAIDYSRPPDPPLRDTETAWAAGLIKAS